MNGKVRPGVVTGVSDIVMTMTKKDVEDRATDAENDRDNE